MYGEKPFSMTVTVNKEELLGKLRENREKHRDVFEAALSGYRTEAMRALEKHITALRDGRTPEIRILLSRPEDHTRDYDRVIGMVQMHQLDSFTLDEVSYSQYVDDDWSWKRQWLDLSSTYAAGTVKAVYGPDE